jgi:hypothetical protein
VLEIRGQKRKTRRVGEGESIITASKVFDTLPLSKSPTLPDP